MMEVFQSYGVSFISSTEKFDTSTPIGRAMLNLCAVFAQLERETIQKRVSDAYRSRSQKGFYMGGRVPFGFRVEQIKMDGISTSRYQPVKEEIRWVKEMFSFYAQQEASLGELAQYLKELGAVNRQGKVFVRLGWGSSFGIRFTSRRTEGLSIFSRSGRSPSGSAWMVYRRKRMLSVPRGKGL